VPDILVNNAAVFGKDTLAGIREEAVSAALRINLLAPLFLMKQFAAAHNGSTRRRRGRQPMVINILDARVAQGGSDGFSYTLSKRALAAATEQAAVELAPIAVNAVAPGPVIRPESVSERAGPMILPRACTPDDVADAVIYLADSSAVTGQTIFVDSGQRLIRRNVPTGGRKS
jgi:NAD(P)-dependent dehydrogenase (short-subunit alcohol dehydrogenase family)